ncbi:MAG: class I SAM-dependent methyltransferase [Planctomycetes bacterium]|nr:class I SAM-dependent methyltransferase [Planctomycetota bacterium]
MAYLSEYARRKKVQCFLERIPKHHNILEIGCGDGWVKDYLKSHGWTHYTGIDLTPPADIVGDIRSWRRLGLQPQSFDTIIAFEVVEHVDCFKDCYELLRPGGTLMVTTPIPCMDWALKLLETVGLSQKRTSPHDQLVDLSRVRYFEQKTIRTIAFLSQWGVLAKAPA